MLRCAHHDKIGAHHAEMRLIGTELCHPERSEGSRSMLRCAHHDKIGAHHDKIGAHHDKIGTHHATPVLRKS